MANLTQIYDVIVIFL